MKEGFFNELLNPIPNFNLINLDDISKSTFLMSEREQVNY